MRDYTAAGHDAEEARTRKNILLFTVIGVACALSAAGGVALLFMAPDWLGMGDAPASNDSTHAQSDAGTIDVPPGEVIEIGIAYGTEKKRWLLDAVDEWKKTPAASQVKINLLPMGSLEGAHAVLAEDKRIHVWSPASSVYKDSFEIEWKLHFSGDPIYAEDTLAISPMVFVMWEERYQEFIRKYGEVSFDTVRQALNEPGGWNAIAGKEDWGPFKFGHTHPNKSNSGLVSLILMAYDYNGKTKDLALSEINNAEFQNWFEELEKGVDYKIHSTNTLMERMVQTGPGAYDAVMVYENVAMDNVATAAGRWGEIRIVYPKMNILNDNPYYVLNAPWSDDEHKKAAKLFLEFLMTERIQRLALDRGFRPGNVRVPIKFPGSPFSELESYGVQVSIDSICEPPKGSVLNNLQIIWQRRHGD